MAEEMNREAGAAMGPAVPPCPNGQLYTVKPGDSMFVIARQFGIPLSSLIAANPQIPDPNTIFPGQILCVPGVMVPPVSCPGGFVHTVQSGDSLFAIAVRFGVTLEALKAANPQITNPDLIYPGQAVCVPAPRPPVTCPNGTLYTVKAGDTMLDIATRFGVTLQALLAANPQVTDPNRIFAGQTLCIPSLPVTPAPPAPVVISPIVSPVPVPPAVPVMPPPPPVAPMPTMPMPAVPPIPLPMPVMPPCPRPMPPCPMPMPCPARPPIMIEPIRRRRKHHHKRHRCDWPC